MLRYRTAFPTLFTLFLAAFASAQNPPASDPQALSYAAQSISAVTGGTVIADVTLTGTVVWNGSDSGAATLRARGNGESRIDLALSGGTRTEIRDAQTGTALGHWTSPNSSSGDFAAQNCWTDAVWFFPVLGSLALGPNVVLSYVGQENRNGLVVQHIQSYSYQPNPPLAGPTPQHLSTMDFYLDANTLLPVASVFNVHPDNNPSINLTVEIDFSNYRNLNGVTVPLHIQKYSQGNLLVDITISQASFNTGLPLALFTID